MTFKKFSQILAEKKPEATAYPHGRFGGVPDVAITFTKDGKESKVYHYRGSYAEILRKFGIKTVSKEDVVNTEWLLEMAKENHGKPSIFTKEIVDNTKEINRLTALLNAYNSNEYVRDWE